MPPADLAREVAAGLRTQRFGRPLYVYPRVTSTNDVARELADGGAPEGTAVLALEQSRGRGRLGRTWASPPGGLYLSVILRPALQEGRWPLLGLAMAVGVAAAAEAHTSTPVLLKWPNDLLLNGGKVGGILVEAAGDCAVCGIGINVQPSREAPVHAAALASAVRPVSIAALARDVLLESERRYEAIGEDPAAVLEECRQRSITLGHRVHVEGATVIEGVAEDIDADGALLVRTDDGVRRIVVGDVSRLDMRE